jgi:hypothetical protein
MLLVSELTQSVQQLLAEMALETGITSDLPDEGLWPEEDWVDIEDEPDGLEGQDAEMITIIK